MIGPGVGARVYLACGVTDMRKGITGLAVLAQDRLADSDDGAHVFRSDAAQRSDLIARR